MGKTNVLEKLGSPSSLENHGFYGFYWFLRCFVSMGSKNIGKTNVF